jgi:hypothetical protein
VSVIRPYIVKNMHNPGLTVESRAIKTEVLFAFH